MKNKNHDKAKQPNTNEALYYNPCLPRGFQYRVHRHYTETMAENRLSKDDTVECLLATRGDTIAERFHGYALPAWNDGDAYACVDEIYSGIASLMQILVAIECEIRNKKLGGEE